MAKTLSHGNIHRLPTDFAEAISVKKTVAALWEDITPLARSEWICWITSGKLAGTRPKRIRVAINKMSGGMRRPCCWAGCPHH